MVSLLENFHATSGDVVFISALSALAVFLSLKLIPRNTEMMVNSAAGLAGKYLGRQYRTLVINCSTNNPEVVTMLISLFLVSGAKRYGGIGTPLGSNFANIYLIFLVALAWTLARLFLRNRYSFFKLLHLLHRERRLIAWHLVLSIITFGIATVSFQLIKPLQSTTGDVAPTKFKLCMGAGLCLAGVAIYLWRESGLRTKRPELFEEIDDEHHVASWTTFVLGTLGLMICCYLLNLMFEVASNIYGTTLSLLFGPAVFAMMHYFLGALVTSLPEMIVAVNNYERTDAPDLNTALSSASASNMSNLAVAGIGCFISLFV